MYVLVMFLEWYLFGDVNEMVRENSIKSSNYILRY